MSEIKVSQMPEANNINDNDLLMIIQGGYNKKISKELLGIPTKAHQINVGSDTDYRVNLLKTKNLFDAVLEQGTFSDVGVKSASSTNYRSATMIAVKPNITYTFSINGVSQKYAVYYYNSEGTFINAEGLTSGTFTTPANTKYINMRCFNADYVSDYANLKIQLEEGSTATEYTPFIPNQINVDNEKYSDTINVGAEEDSRSRVNVLKSKNLWHFDKVNTLLGVTITYNNSELTINGTATGSGDILGNTSTGITLPAGTYTIKVSYISGDYTLNNKELGLYIRKSDGTFLYTIYLLSSNGKTSKETLITLNETTTLYIQDYVNGSGLVFSNLKFSIQLNEGSTALPYEPYVVPSIKVDNEEILIPQATEWMTLNSNFGVYYRKVGFNVEIRMNKGQTAQSITSSPTTLGTLPSGFEPKENIFMPVANETAPSVRLLVLNTGAVQIQALGGGSVSLGYAGTYITYSTL